jgi:UDP-N-acetylmuramoyl-L-alanyl-D-glutamate--2,6-diaminopimelate ligase
MEIHLSELTDPDASAPSGHDSTPGFRPTAVAAVPLAAIGAAIGVAVPGASSSVEVTGISLNSRAVRPGDLYVALPAPHGTGPTSCPKPSTPAP